VIVDVLLDQYSVEEDQLTVDVTSSRRLVARQLSSSDSNAWQVDFEITASEEAVNDAFDIAASQANGTGDAISSFTSALSTAFQGVGVTLDVSSISVSQPVIKVVTATMTTVSTTGTQTEMQAVAAATSVLTEEKLGGVGLEIIVVGAAAVVCAILVLLLCFLLRHRRQIPARARRLPPRAEDAPDVGFNNDNDNSPRGEEDAPDVRFNNDNDNSSRGNNAGSEEATEV
jgi:hypothetical protein